MSEFAKCNKVAGVHWFKPPLEKLSIKIKPKSKENILTLPKFEEYKEKTDEENLHILESNKVEEYTFNWQEKVFSNWEIQHYSDTYNCNTETELKYHDMIKDLNYVPTKIFTYINEDYRLPLPLQCKRSLNQSMVPNLNDCFMKLSLEEFVRDDDTLSSRRHLFKSEENVLTEEEQWIAMHIVLDSSEYNEDSQLLYKEEHILLSLYHNATNNYVIVSPDVNDIEYNAYSVEDQAGLEYGVEIELGEETSTELVDLLHSLLKKCEKKQNKLLSFAMPPLGRRKFFVTLEIVSAVGFDLDKLYIEYHIKIPDDLEYSGNVHGRTHTSEYLDTEESREWKYGHTMELELECATGIDPSPLKIFLEAISVDWWGRHRTEGYGYLTLTLKPGNHVQHLSCSRPEELDTVEANNRRFFVGGCHLIKDLDVLSNPQLHKTNFKYVSTGIIAVRWGVISHSQSTALFPTTPQASGSAILNGAEAVLRKYKKAKATLAAATKLLPTDIDSR